MSKQYEFSTGPFTLRSPGPATVEEFDAKAGAGECLSGAVSDCIYRGHIPTFWDEFIPQVEKLTGIERGVDAEATARAKARQKADSKAVVKDVPEKFGKYINRVLASLDDSAKAEITSLATATASKLEIDPSPARRSSGPGAANLAKADDVLSREASAIEATIGKLLSVVGEFDLDREADGKPTRESLAALIKAYTVVVSAV